MNIDHLIDLNLSENGIPPRLSMPQGDTNSRAVVATLWDGAQPYVVPDNTTVMVRFRKPDGTGGLYDTTEGGESVTVSGSTVTAPVASQMLAVAGTVFAELDLFGADTGAAAAKLATFRFVVDCTPCVYPDAEIISSDYYNIVAAQIAGAVSAAGDSEAWAVGQRGGADVPSADETYHNNAKYWATQAQQAAGGGVTSFNGRSGGVEPKTGDYTKAMVGLGNVDNTSDLSKPISTATQAALNKKAGVSTAVTATLSASGWSGSAAPYTYTLTVSGVTTASYQEIVPALNITAAQLAALQAANIQDGGQAANTVTLKAFGTKPTIDIPVRVIKRGD